MRTVAVTLHVRKSPQAVPLAAGCLIAALPEELRAEARLVELFPDQPLTAMVQAVLAHEPQLVAFSLYVWNRERLLALVRQLRQTAPEMVLVAGGPEVGCSPRDLVGDGLFDAVIPGEGESLFAGLAQRLAAGRNLELPGVVTAAGNGDKAVPPPPPAELPSPWLSGVLDPAAAGGVLWEVSRGCPFACDFCFDGRGSNRVRHLPQERLAHELELFVRQGVSQVWVLDSTFNYPPERGKKLLRLLAEKAPHIHFHFEAKADFLDRETARLLSALSCSVQIGLQSADAGVLKRIHRSLDLAQFGRKVAMLAMEGVTYGFDLIFGLPGDDLAGFRRSLGFALAQRPNQLDIFPLAVLPGTVLHREQEKHALQCQSQPPYEVLATPTFGRDDLDRARLLAAATDIFYNRGRAVGFFMPLLKAVAIDACGFLDEFVRWLRSERQLVDDRILAVETWQPRAIRDLQMDFAAHLLNAAAKGHLLPAARDLIRYHYHYAEAVLGPETLPAEGERLRGLDLWTTCWQLNPAARVVRFRFEIVDLLQVEEMDLDQFINLFRPVGSTALFIRRGSEVYCESLEEDFAKLLQGSDGGRSPRDIFAGSINRREGEEFVEFAVSEGILLPPEN